MFSHQTRTRESVTCRSPRETLAMESDSRTPENSTMDEETELPAISSVDSSLALAAPPPFSSLSLSLSALIPTNLFLPRKYASILTSPPTKARIPSQISALCHVHISASLTPPKPFFKSTSFSANPLQNPLPLTPSGYSDPSSAAGFRRASIVWFRNDLRVQDNECLNSAHDDSISVLPVYCFDPRDYGKSSSGFDKTGPYRATFLRESVSDLRRNLQEKGSDLVVRMGKPEIVLVELAKEVGADAVYAHREVSHDEVKSEEDVEVAMKNEGVEVKYFWGSTLCHVDDLPFELEKMPSQYGKFKEKIKGLDVRKTIAALGRLKGLPSRGGVEPGEIPTLAELGLRQPVPTTQEGKNVANAPVVGGETEGFQRLRNFAAECEAKQPKGSTSSQESIYGANFSCKISPWLTVGCISPRMMFEELKKSASRMVCAQKGGGNDQSDDGMNWLIYELLWRDFFRFITRKYSSVKKQLTAAPMVASFGALA